MMAEKKVVAAKPAVTKKEVAKPAAKAPAKAVAKPVVKAVAKPVAKTAPVAKAPVTKVAPVAKPATVKKSAPKPAVKKVAKESDKKILSPASAGDRGLRKTRIGKVVSNKMNKTIVVAIVNKVPHPLYRKVVVTTTKFKAHDENNECSIGDTVEIMETRPLSRDKYFRLVKIIEKVK